MSTTSVYVNCGCCGGGCCKTCFCQGVGTHVSCPITGVSSNDLGCYIGSGDISVLTGPGFAAYHEKITWDSTQTVGCSGNYTASVNVTFITGGGGGNIFWRFRIQILDASCVVLYNSAYSTPSNLQTVVTLTENITWPVGGTIARISFENNKLAGPLPGGTAVTCDSNSYLIVPAPCCCASYLNCDCHPANSLFATFSNITGCSCLTGVGTITLTNGGTQWSGSQAGTGCSNGGTVHVELKCATGNWQIAVYCIGASFQTVGSFTCNPFEVRIDSYTALSCCTGTFTITITE